MTTFSLDMKKKNKKKTMFVLWQHVLVGATMFCEKKEKKIGWTVQSLNPTYGHLADTAPPPKAAPHPSRTQL